MNTNDFKDFFQEESNPNNAISIRELLELYLFKWYWFVISIVICLLIAFFYLKYQTNIYQSNADILIEESQNNAIIPDFEGFQDLFGGNNKVLDQTYVLRSYPILNNVVKKLNLDIDQSRLTKFSKEKVNYFNNSPLKIIKIKELEDFITPIEAEIEIVNKDQFILRIEDFIKKFDFGSHIKIYDKVIIKVDINPDFFKNKPINNLTVDVLITPLEQKTNEISNLLKVSEVDKLSNIILLSYQSDNLKEAKDFLNQLIEEYSYNSVKDKKKVAESTTQFIDDRINLLTDELSRVESNIESFKRKNNLTDIVTEAQQYTENTSELQKKISENEIKYDITNYLSKYINQNESNLIPNNIGLDDPRISSEIEKYNQLILERNRYSQTTTPENPEYKIINDDIHRIKRSIQQTLDNQKSSLRITISSLQSESNNNVGKLHKIPQQEKQYREIFRQQQTKEALFLFLLQKREEVAIADVSIQPDFKTINYAYGSYQPISPNRPLIYLFALLLGIIIPILYLYVKNLLNTKIYNSNDLEKLTNIPIIGNISRNKDSKEAPLISKSDRSSTAESLRLLVTNLEFLLSELPDTKTILVTSTLSGEGKTFISANLAVSLAYNGYKVVMIGMDIRAPKIHEYFHIQNQKGVTHFVRNENLDISDITNNYEELPNLDVINSGTILPNFIDILTNKRIDELFSKLKENYDYIIIDSAPVGLVSDTFNIAKFIDLCLFVVRAEYLDKRMIRIVERINKEKKFPKTYLILNDVDVESKRYGNSYGYGYGYGYGESKKKKSKFWQRKFWEDKLLKK